MPNYYLNGDRYDIPDEVVADFEKDNPDAVISYRNGNDIYDIPVSEKEGFLKAYPKATLYDGETKERTTSEVVTHNPEGSNALPSQSSKDTDAVLNDNSAGPQRQLKQPSLRELAGGKRAIAPIESVVNNWTGDRNDARFLQGQQAARLQKAWRRGELDALDSEEERRIDAAYTSKPVTSSGDIVENYRNRFALTRRGKELQNEYAAIGQETANKYLREFMNTPAYREVMSRQYPSEEERNKAINEAFQSQYGERISQEMRPYAEALDAQMMNRYRGRIDDDLRKFNKETTSRQLQDITREVENLEGTLRDKAESRRGAYGGYAYATPEEARESNLLRSARKLIGQSQDIVDEAGKKGRTNVAASTLRGVRDNLDIDAITLGIADAVNANNLNQALEKYERGETLTEAEQKLLEASAVNMAVQTYYGSDLGKGYKAGQTTAVSLPFMLEFAVNPISGSGNAIAKSLLKFGLRRFGRAGSFAARVAGSTGAALGMTGTTGAPRVASNAMERLNQNYEYYLDENDNLHVQKTGDTGIGEAIGKSIASTALENQSEMVLNAFRVFRPYLRGMENALPGGVNSFMKMVKKSRPAQLYRELKNNPTLRELVQRTQFQGLPQEYLEEVYNNFANIPLGDMTLEEATDLDNNLDIVLGLTPTFLAFGMIGAGSMAAERYQNRRRMERIFGKMTDEQRKKFDELQRMSREHGNEDIKEFIRYTMSDPDLTQQQKREEIEYAFAIATQNAIDEVQEAETQDRIDAETQDILSNSDPKTNTYTECARIVVNDVGEQVEVPGHIVGYMGGQPLWKPDGAGPEVEAVVLKEGEYNPESIRSMPTQEVIDETAQAIREDAAEQARRESTYSPDIVPPSIGTTFTNGTAQYQIVQKNPDKPDGGWLATRTTLDEKGKPVQEVVPVTEQEYYDMAQAQIDAQEQQTATKQATNGEYTGNTRRLNETASQTAPANQAQRSSQRGSETAPSSLQGETSLRASEELAESEASPRREQGIDSTEPAETGIPTDEKGNPLYHRAPVERTVSSINAEGLEPDEVDAFIQANKDAAAKQLKSIEGKAPKMGTNIAKYKADKSAWQARVADAQAQVDYWNQVGETISAQRTQVGDTTAEDIRAMGEPLNGHELAAMMLATGRLPLLQSDFIRETGYRSGEARNLFGLFASEANGGMTIERAGEQLMLADQEDGTHFFDPDDPNAGRNAILDVLAEVRTRGDLTNYIRRNREAMAERERQAEYDAYADWCDREMHMTPEEYEAYQEYIAENNPYEGVAVEELDRIFAEAEEAYHNNITSQHNGQEGTSENGSETDSGPSQRHEPAGEAGGWEASVPVLPGAQPVLQGQVQGRAGGTETEPRPADDGVRAAEGAVAEGASGSKRITDGQGNPVDNDGRLITEAVNDVSEISDLDFTHPTRNIELPKLPEAVDDAIGANGKPVIIKRNIFARNAQRHGDLSPENSREILREALYNTSLYGQNQKAKKPYNWVLINVPDNNGNNRVVLLEVNHHKDNVEIVHWHYVDERGLEKIRRQAEREDGQLLILPSVTSEEVGALSDPTLSLSSDGKSSDSSANSQTNNGFIAPERQEDENLLDYAEHVAKSKEIADARKEVSANPTDAQKEAGNYKKGHITLDGYDITIENPKGSTRSGVDANGQPWSVTMNNDYGYIRGTEGVDGDHIDVFLSDDPTTGDVFVIDQVNEDGTFDEHKVMYGFKSALAAKRAYLANYSPGWKGLGTISEVSKEEFKKWVNSSHRKTKPFAEYKSVKVEGAQSDSTKERQPHALPGRLMKAYESGDASLIGSVEQEMRDFVNGANDIRSVYATYLRSRDLERSMEKGSPSNKTQHLIAEACKDALKKAGLPAKAMQSERARTEAAGSTTDARVLDIMSADSSMDVLSAIIRNPNTAESTLKYFTEAFSNNGLDYDAQQELYKRQVAKNSQTASEHLPDEGKMSREQEETEKVKQQSGPVEKIEDVGEKIGGAKKDRFKEFVEREKQLQEKPDSFMEELRKLPVSKIFNFNLEALRKDGLSNEAATLIDVIRRVIPSKPRTDWKLKRWVSDVFGLYRFCLTLATAEQGTFDQVLERVTNIKQIGGMYRAQMALGGFDSGLDTGQATLEELGDSAGHYDKDDNWVSLKGQWYVAHAGRYGGIYPDYEKAKEALAQFAGENSKGKEKGTEVKFSVYSYKNSGESFITPKGKPNIIVESGFKSSKEALDYLNEHMDELQSKYRNMKDATSIGFAPNSERRGKDWRGGKDVTAEDFRNTFGFRGVEFGNWANQQERQLALNQAYDAFMDLSEATGISPQGLSLGGELGMAFGARGGGGAAAHYEPGKVVINLTKTQGAGTLAHEWWHAIDNYFSRRRGQALGYNTERKGYKLPVRGGKVEREHEAERKEITNAFSALMKAIEGSSYGQRSNAYASLKSSYWKKPTELGARAFAVWVERKLSEKGIVNNFLANNNTIGWESPELTQKYYPYPLESDFDSLDTAFDNLFGAIEEKVDEETGNTILYRFIGEQGAARLDAAEEATTRLDNLTVARKMEEEGKNAWTIKSATGWERGADRKWRYETPDFEYTPPEDFEEGKNYNLSDIIKDDELFKAYPRMKELNFRLEHLPDEYSGGWYGGNEIVINTAYNNPLHYESTIAHEIQHAVQDYEGFETGDSPDVVIDRYLDAQYEIDSADINTLNVAAFVRKRAERLVKRGKYKYMRWAVRSAMGPLRGRNDMYAEYGPIETLTVYHTAKELKDAYEKAYQAGKSIFTGMPTRKDAMAAYMRNAGETEARNVERRLQLTPEQRRNMLASETEDVAHEDQLFINSALRKSISHAPVSEYIGSINERFNEELSGLTEDNADKVTLDLGNPSPVLLAAGVEDKPMKLYGNKVIKKMKKHGFKLDELRNLPEAVAEPIAVFNNYQKEGNRSILTELETANGNFLVTIDLGKDADVDFNIVTSVFGKGDNNIITWINKGYATYIDKQKTLDYLHHSALKAVTSDNREEKVQEFLSHQSAPIAATAANSELSDATKIVENFENPIIDSEISRNSNVNLSDEALSTANDPVAKLLGKSTRTARQRKEFAERERRNMAKRVQELAEKLHLDNVEIVTEPMTITDRQGRTHHPKGFYNPRTGKIVIVVPNNVNTFDVEQTLLHEAVAHYGLRRLFGEHFDTFLDNVYNNADLEVRRKIVELAKKNGWDARLATEEYLASLAEDTNFDDLNASWWEKIKSLFLDMLHKIGFDGFTGVTLSDNELRYILWRSYENLAEPGRYRSILGEAADIVKQNELKVGNYTTSTTEVDKAAEEINDLYRITPDGFTSDDGTREAYNRAVSGNRFKAQEAYQDSMLALKRLQEVIEQKTGKLKSYENAYLAENQMSSKSTRETEVYGEKYFKPMLEAVGKLMEKGVFYGEIIDYMVAKHGLERNEVFAKRDAEQEASHRYEKLYKEIEQLYKLGGITEEKYDQRKNKLDTEKEEYYQKRLAKHLDEDYSGLTALAEKYDAIDEGFKAHAKKLITDFEGRFDTKDLWVKVNAATKETLRKSYESGMMSSDIYEKVSKQFKYYIPLRGWDEQTAEDVYEYINSETSPVNSVLKTAKGRRSMADDPLATIGNMAESTILQGNRNLMKQNFLNMAINHPTDVLTLKEAWYVQDPTTGDWILSFPDIREGDDASAISAKVDEHEQRMQELKANGLATQVKEGLDINYRIGARQAQEHIVTVKRNGKDYLVFVNGNPRAAQAVNGLTNPNVENGWMAGVSRFNRWMAANFTTRNPAFVLSNLFRDLIFSTSAVAVKEGSSYARKFSKNIYSSMRAIARGLRGKEPRTDADRYFQEFLDNGGETGFTALHNVDEYKRIVRKELKKLNKEMDYLSAVKWAADKFSVMNRWAEDVARFNAYMTSRQQGKTITESINDAKEVTVNFNRKGAGFKTKGPFGKTSGVFRGLYLFFNAAVQSLANFIKLGKKNPKAFITLLGGFTAAGFLVPMLNALLIGDGDDDYYDNLPNWVRRNNLCIYVGDGKFFTLPLPIELRAFYGLGEMAYQAMVGKDEYASENVAYAAINQITELLPLNPLGNNGDIVTTFVPDFFIPFWEAGTNEDFTGKPVFKDTPFNESMPEWTKAYKGTSAVLVDASEKLNEWTGGDKYKKGWIDKVQLKGLNLNNPAQIEHIFEGYFGGMAKTINQAAKTLAGGVESAIEGKKSDKLQWYSTPVLNRFVNDASDDRSSYSKVNQRYYQLYNLYDEVQKLNRGYANEAARGNLDYLGKLNELYQSEDYKKYLIFKSNKRAIDRIRDIEKRLPEESGEQRKKLQEETNKLKRQLVEMVDKLE